MRGERKHHDSDIQRRERERQARRSIGLSLRELTLRMLFWPDELDRLALQQSEPEREAEKR